MPPKSVTPAFGLKSFSCPTCGALASQEWFRAFAQGTTDSDPPKLFGKQDLQTIVDQTKQKSDQIPKSVLEVWAKEASGELTLREQSDSTWSKAKIVNLHISQCFSCSEIAVWKHDTVLFPAAGVEIEPNADLAADIKADFVEAVGVLQHSPRAAAALLRLCVQKLCIQLGLPGKNINEDIGELVSNGLDSRLAKALDVVRVVGNESVHPGEMDLRDNREVAVKLFGLVNQIAFQMISHPKEIDELYASLPQSKRDAIGRRDS